MKTPACDNESSPQFQKFQAAKDFAKAAIPEDVLSNVLGGEIVRQDNIMSEHFELSGKLKILDKLLKKYSQIPGTKVLLFSYSTQTLDLIQSFLKAQAYSFCRMDGSTPSSKRQSIADEFNSKPEKFIFLLSTKAMGVGLNLMVCDETDIRAN